MVSHSFIIDFHTHTFPDHLAERAVKKLSMAASLKNYTDGTSLDLKKSMLRSGIHYSVLLPVATKPEHTGIINEIAKEVNDASHYNHLISFGSIHPENQNYQEILSDLAICHVPGIKLQPMNQRWDIDDPLYLRIIDAAVSRGLLVTIHAGFDSSAPGDAYTTVDKLSRMIQSINSENIILAHMGGWDEWDQVEKYIVGTNVRLDTSFTLTPLRHINQAGNIISTEPGHLSEEQFVRIIRHHGVSKILFGSDSPWGDQREALSLIQKSRLTEEEKRQIVCGNAMELLKPLL